MKSLIPTLAALLATLAITACTAKPTPEQCATGAENVLKVVSAELAGSAEDSATLIRASEIAGDAAKKFAGACPNASADTVQCFIDADTMAAMDACKKANGG